MDEEISEIIGIERVEPLASSFFGIKTGHIEPKCGVFR